MALPEFFQQFESDAKRTSEKMAHYYLEHLGLGKVCFEPDGEDGPDFVIDGCIAVEVRLLNEHVFGRNKIVSSDDDTYRISGWLISNLGKVSANRTDESWFVGVRYKRPFRNSSRLTKTLLGVLNEFAGKSQVNSVTLKIPKSSIELDLFRASKPHATFFVLAGVMEDEPGAMLLETFETNLRYVLKDKADKVRKRMGTYAAWWLLLVDKISYTTLSESELAYFREAFPQEALHPFKRVILLCGNEPRRGIDFLGS